MAATALNHQHMQDIRPPEAAFEARQTGGFKEVNICELRVGYPAFPAKVSVVVIEFPRRNDSATTTLVNFLVALFSFLPIN